MLECVTVGRGVFMDRLAFKIARITAWYTQQTLADEIGASQQTVAKWEASTNTPQQMKVMRELEVLLNKNMVELFPDVFG